MTDWSLIKTQYEILGKGVEELCKTHHIKPDILRAAIESQGWEANPVVVDPDVNDALNDSAQSMQVAHQANIIPTYIEIETAFLSRLKDLVSKFEDAAEAKKLAETLEILKPAVMKAAESQAKGADAGGFKLLIQNQFPVPQPGDANFIPANAVIIGEAAGQGTDVDQSQNPGLMRLNVDIDDREERLN